MGTREPHVGVETDEDRGRDDAKHRDERIGVGAGDDAVVRIQLAARWAEVYSSATDPLGSVLKRFRAAFDYVDAVTHGIPPQELDADELDTRVLAPTGEVPTAAPSSE